MLARWIGVELPCTNDYSTERGRKNRSNKGMDRQLWPGTWLLPGYGARYEGGGDKKQIPPDRDDTRLLPQLRDNVKMGDNNLIFSTLCCISMDKIY